MEEELAGTLMGAVLDGAAAVERLRGADEVERAARYLLDNSDAADLETVMSADALSDRLCAALQHLRPQTYVVASGSQLDEEVRRVCVVAAVAATRRNVLLAVERARQAGADYVSVFIAENVRVPNPIPDSEIEEVYVPDRWLVMQ